MWLEIIGLLIIVIVGYICYVSIIIGLPRKWALMNPMFKMFVNSLIKESDPEKIEKALKRDAPIPANVSYPDISIEKIQIEEGSISVNALHVKSSKQENSNGKRKIVLFFHGGGFVMSSPKEYLAIFVEMIRKTNCEIYAPDYSKGPKYKYPAAHDDALGCYRFILKQGASEIIVMGDSAGGSLAGHVCYKSLELKQRQPDLVVLVYPGCDTMELRKKRSSYQKFGGFHYLLTKELTQWMWKQYFGTTQPDYLNSKDWNGFTSRVLVQIAQYDILHDEVVELAEHLKAGKVSVRTESYPTIHGGFSLLGSIAFTDAYSKMLKDVIEFIK